MPTCPAFCTVACGIDTNGWNFYGAGIITEQYGLASEPSVLEINGGESISSAKTAP